MCFDWLVYKSKYQELTSTENLTLLAQKGLLNISLSKQFK